MGSAERSNSSAFGPTYFIAVSFLLLYIICSGGLTDGKDGADHVLVARVDGGGNDLVAAVLLESTGEHGVPRLDACGGYRARGMR